MEYEKKTTSIYKHEFDQSRAMVAELEKRVKELDLEVHRVIGKSWAYDERDLDIPRDTEVPGSPQ